MQQQRTKKRKKQQNHTKNAFPTTNFVRCSPSPAVSTTRTQTRPPAHQRARFRSFAEGYEEGESRETSVVMGRSSTNTSSTSSTSVSLWEDWLEEALQALQSSMLLRSLRPLAPSEVVAAVAGRDCKSPRATGVDTPSFQTFQGLGTWDRAAVEVEVSRATFQCWNQESPSTGSCVVVSLLILCALCLRVSVFLLVIFVSLCVLKIWRSMRFFVFPPHSCTSASIERNNILEPPRARCLSSAFGDFFCN